jgi:hypothetical protein
VIKRITKIIQRQERKNKGAKADKSNRKQRAFGNVGLDNSIKDQSLF